MKREAKLLLNKAVNSLVLSFDHFNRAWDKGRVETVLILLDHSFEMLLKASLVERGSKIRERRAKNTIGFDHCIRKALTEGNVKFLTEEQALTLQVINSFRDAAQHYLLDISEEQLYMTTQSGVTLFRNILKTVFNKELKEYLPERVLPLSTLPPIEISVLFENEVTAIKSLLQPGRRQKTEALARIRPLAIMDAALQGQTQQLSDGDLGKLSRAITQGKQWEEIFPGVALIEVTATGSGPTIEIHWTKKEGIAIHTVPEGTPESSVVALKRVNELDFYCLSLTQVCEKVGVTQPKCLAAIYELDLQSNPDYFKEIQIGKMVYKRYSQKAVKRIQEALAETSIDDIWQKQRHRFVKSQSAV